jgi:uncharacterized protein YbjT (DUF2867 family)
MASAPTKTVLVTGSTGKQGGAVIDNLLSSAQASSFHIVAVTRDTNTPRAKKLASRPNVSVIAGDLSNTDAIFAKSGPVWGVYSVQINSDAEEAQGKALIDAAVSHGVQHFVYSSCDRGGPEKSAVDPTNVKNFAAKFRIEKHLESLAVGSKQQMTYTILRPASFMENLTTDRHGQGYARMWEQLGSKPLQIVSTTDIGFFAAQSFLHPEKMHKAAPSLVGDELTQPQADVIFREVVGKSMPLAPCLVGSAVKFILKDTVGDMFLWFAEDGFKGDVQECRRAYPQMQNFRAWLQANKGQWLKEGK